MGNRESSIGGDAVRLTISKFITLLITTVTSMLLSRYRTFEEYGTYSELLLVVNLISSLVMLGLPSSINFFLARAETVHERTKFLSVYYTLSTALSAFMGMALVLAIPIIESYFHNDSIKYFYYFLALYPWASVICGSIENLLVVYSKTKLLTEYRLLYSIVMLAIAVVVQKLSFGFSTYMICFVIGNALFAVWVYYIANKLSQGIHISLDVELIKAIFVFSIPMGLSTLVGTLNSEIDKLLIGYLLNTEQLAIYTNAAKELPLTIVATSITAVLLPKLTLMVKQGRSKEAVRLWGYATELSFAIIAVIVAGVFTYAEEAIAILYSEKYLAGVVVFRIYTLNLLFRITYFGMVLNAFGKSKKIFLCSVASLVLNAVLNPLFYLIFGMIGPAIATLLAIVLVNLLQLAMTSKLTEIKFAKIFPWKNMANVLILNGLLAVAFYLFKRVLSLEVYFSKIGEAIILGIVWIIVYGAVISKYLNRKWKLLNQ